MIMIMSTPNGNEPIAKNVSTMVPPHLNDSAWLAYEYNTMYLIYEGLRGCLQNLADKQSAKNVHEARVSLRRWDCIWKVLQDDGWQSKKYHKHVGKKLKTIRQMLGALRDCDVNLEIAQTLVIPEIVVKKWKYDREKLARQAKRELSRIDIEQLLKKMDRFLEKRPLKLESKLDRQGFKTADSAYHHLEPFIAHQEEIARELAQTANTAEELHKLRLAIKAWRYLLAEFYGLTNLQLVRAQQILGKLNDLHRVAGLLEASESRLAKESLSKLSEQQIKLLNDFSEFRKSLPFGLRPSLSSISGYIKSN